jgi:hypothetical protein
MNNEIRELTMDELESASGGGATVTSFTWVRIDTPKGTLCIGNGVDGNGVPINTAQWNPK